MTGDQATGLDAVMPGGAAVLSQGLALTRIGWQITPLQAGCLPPWKGSTLRGALGWAIAAIAGAAPSPAWPGLGPTTSLADAFFAPQKAWNSPRATPVWTLQCPDQRTAITPEQPIDGALILFGAWPAWACDLLQEAFQRACTNGLGQASIPCCLSTWQTTTMAWPTPPPGAHAVTLTCQTPCRLEDERAVCQHLNATAIIRSLIRRWRALHIQLQDHDPLEGGLGQGVHAAAAHVQAIVHASQPHRLTRLSNRQQRRHDLPTLTGSLTFGGPLWEPFAPLLAAAEVLHIGKQAHFGLGQCTLTWHLEHTAVSDPACSPL